MTNERGLSEITVAVFDWAFAHGADGAHSRPGLWRGETAATEHEDALTVEINPHMDEVDGISPASARITPADKMGKIAIVVVNPYGGSMTGFDEDSLIAHFKAQPS